MKQQPKILNRQASGPSSIMTARFACWILCWRSDEVLCHNVRWKPNEYRKWKLYYTDQSVIEQNINDVTFLVKLRNGRKKIFHCDKLRLLKRCDAAAAAVAAGATAQSVWRRRSQRLPSHVKSCTVRVCVSYILVCCHLCLLFYVQLYFPGAGGVIVKI